MRPFWEIPTRFPLDSHSQTKIPTAPLPLEGRGMGNGNFQRDENPADTPMTVGFRLYPPETLIALDRCPDCSFHELTQGHREGCRHLELGNNAYRRGLCKTCRQHPYAPGHTECDCCTSTHPERNPTQ
jgi:hypothetical protein